MKELISYVAYTLHPSCNILLDTFLIVCFNSLTGCMYMNYALFLTLQKMIKTMGESSTAQVTRTDGSPFWIDDDLSKVKGPERGGNVRCVGKFAAVKKRRVEDPQVPILKAEVKGLREDLMSLVAAIKEHIPGLNLSIIISRANMEVKTLCLFLFKLYVNV